MKVDNLAEFFYNLVPGWLFLVGLLLLTLPSPIVSSFLENHVELLLLASIISGLFIGFLFEGITRGIKRKDYYKNIFESLDKNPLYNIAKDALQDKLTITIDSPKKLFELMDNYLHSTNRVGYTDHFATLHAFWSNIMLGSLALSYGFTLKAILNLPERQDYILLITSFILLLLAAFSEILFKRYLETFYDVVLKTFTVSKIDSA